MTIQEAEDELRESGIRYVKVIGRKGCEEYVRQEEGEKLGHWTDLDVYDTEEEALRLMIEEAVEYRYCRNGE